MPFFDKRKTWLRREARDSGRPVARPGRDKQMEGSEAAVGLNAGMNGLAADQRQPIVSEALAADEGRRRAEDVLGELGARIHVSRQDPIIRR